MLKRPMPGGIGVAALLVALASCSTPSKSLDLNLAPGQTRTYRMHAESRTIFDVPGLPDDDATTLDAVLVVRVLSNKGGIAFIEVAMHPESFTRGGKTADPPPPQAAMLTVDDRGTITDVKPGRGSTSPLGGSADDLGTLIGAFGRSGTVSVGDSWVTTLRAAGGAGGKRTSRVTGVRWAGDYRSVRIQSKGTRPSVRERQTASGSVRLLGTETATTIADFAFDAGFPVRLESKAIGLFSVSGSGDTGSVRISSITTLVLAPDAKIPVPVPTPRKKPTVKVTPKP